MSEEGKKKFQDEWLSDPQFKNSWMATKQDPIAHLDDLF